MRDFAKDVFELGFIDAIDHEDVVFIGVIGCGTAQRKQESVFDVVVCIWLEEELGIVNVMRQDAGCTVFDHGTRRAHIARNAAFDEVFIFHIPMERRDAMHTNFAPRHFLPMRYDLLRQICFSDARHAVEYEVFEAAEPVETLHERELFDAVEFIGIVGHRGLQSRHEAPDECIEIDERLFSLIIEIIDEFSHDLTRQIAESNVPQIQIPCVDRHIVAMRTFDDAQEPSERAQREWHCAIFAFFEERRDFFDPLCTDIIVLDRFVGDSAECPQMFDHLAVDITMLTIGHEPSTRKPSFSPK